jgi:hypothetical protein
MRCNTFKIPDSSGLANDSKRKAKISVHVNQLVTVHLVPSMCSGVDESSKRMKQCRFPHGNLRCRLAGVEAWEAPGALAEKHLLILHERMVEIRGCQSLETEVGSNVNYGSNG